MLSNSEVAVFCEQSGMILESGLSMLEGISIMEEDVELHNTEYKKMYEDMRMCLEETGGTYKNWTFSKLCDSNDENRRGNR